MVRIFAAVVPWFNRLESVWNSIEVVHLLVILLSSLGLACNLVAADESTALVVVTVIALHSLSLLRWLDPQGAQLVAP